MSLPALDTRVMLRIPDREVLSGRVDEIGHGWIDVELRHAPRTPLTHLERHWVFMEYVEPAGLVRIMGQVSLSPSHGEGVAHATQTVAIGSAEFAVMDLPGAREGDLYDFTIWPGGNEPPVNGRASVSRVASKGHVVLDFVMVATFERERLGRLLVRDDV